MSCAVELGRLGPIAERLEQMPSTIPARFTDWKTIVLVVLAAGGFLEVVRMDLSDHPAVRFANATSAMSHLRKYSTAQALLSMETGRCTHRLPDLFEDPAFAGIIDEPLIQAWHRNENPIPLSGYLFADIEQDEYGRTLDHWGRCGLSAFPVEPGRTGDKTLLILIDETVELANPGPVQGGDWRLYEASAEEVPGPVTRWPSRSELQEKYRDLTRSPPSGPRS
jgi:hypothetical protein